jgi:hypothetical protein
MKHFTGTVVSFVGFVGFLATIFGVATLSRLLGCERRLFSDDATICPWSPTIIACIYVTVDDRYVPNKIDSCSQANYLMI